MMGKNDQFILSYNFIKCMWLSCAPPPWLLVEVGRVVLPLRETRVEEFPPVIRKPTSLEVGGALTLEEWVWVWSVLPVLLVSLVRFLWVLPWIYQLWLPFLPSLPLPPTAFVMDGWRRPFCRDTATPWNTTDSNRWLLRNVRKPGHIPHADQN